MEIWRFSTLIVKHWRLRSFFDNSITRFVSTISDCFESTTRIAAQLSGILYSWSAWEGIRYWFFAKFVHNFRCNFQFHRASLHWLTLGKRLLRRKFLFKGWNLCSLIWCGKSEQSWLPLVVGNRIWIYWLNLSFAKFTSLFLTVRHFCVGLKVSPPFILRLHIIPRFIASFPLHEIVDKFFTILVLYIAQTCVLITLRRHLILKVRNKSLIHCSLIT